MSEMPTTFECDACHQDQPVDWLCPATSSDVFLWCLVCCGCDVHGNQDVEGTIIWPWRGLA